MVALRVIPAGCFPCQRLLRTSPSFLLFERVYASRGWTTIVRRLRCQLLWRVLESHGRFRRTWDPRKAEHSAELVLQSPLTQSSSGLNWNLVLHALPETMLVMSMRRTLPTSQSGLSVLVHDGSHCVAVVGDEAVLSRIMHIVTMTV